VSQAYAAYADKGIAGLFSNQAGLHAISGVSIEASALQRYFSEGILEMNVGAALPLGTYTAGGIFVRRFGDDIFSEQSFGLALSRQLFESISLGIALEAYQISIENYGNNWQFNTQIGFQADLTKSIRIGTHLFLPLEEPDQLSFSNQALLNIDVSVVAEKHLTVKAGVRKLNDEDLGVKVALIYEPVEKFEIQTGVLTFPSQYSFGAGVDIFNNMQLFATGLFQSDLGWSSGLSLRYVPKQ